MADTSSPWVLYARDNYLQRQGLIGSYSSFECTSRWNDVGSWSLVLDRDAPMALDMTQPGWGIQVYRSDLDQIVFSGFVTNVAGKRTDKENSITLTGKDDNLLLKVRQASPSPGESLPPYTVQAYDVRTGVASTIMRQYVDVNAGGSAVTPRRIAGLTLGTDPLIGSSITGRARWQVLLVCLQELATQGGELGFRCIQSGANIQFQVYGTTDASGTVKFSSELGNLAEWEWEASAPSGNYVFVGGGGEGTARTIVEGNDAASLAVWGRIEGEFVDRRDTTVTSELQQAATDALAQTKSVSKVTFVALDTANAMAFRDYNLGTLISVVADPDFDPVIQMVRELKVSLEHEQVTITPTVSTPIRGGQLNLFAQLKRITDRLNVIERR